MIDNEIRSRITESKRNNASLLNTNQYFGGCDWRRLNIEEYRCNSAVSRERDSVAENLSRSEGRSDNLYRAFTSAIPLRRS